MINYNQIVYIVQIFGSTDRQEIEEGILELVGGFIGLAVGASIVYFIAVSASAFPIVLRMLFSF